ncbi:uncharacterized protein MONBRDRAFT_5542 [Monosiga brevicollis MX1]|uniref:Uncharacterized protein n=1 Tax=Monosiga brevicollis TaxID=81824 RepID=A9URR9_MONBE|nr:uncharacterized protein MONBRDRAFT_5542 [Monosiga brevicollis MX1]EDQ91653.1 predicted protein [Monosiga brevicollis MX1]|eukprot:XP_001742939.1 hypothetical protein [Monosiga brevicollis MX1]
MAESLFSSPTGSPRRPTSHAHAISAQPPKSVGSPLSAETRRHDDADELVNTSSSEEVFYTPRAELFTTHSAGKSARSMRHRSSHSPSINSNSYSLVSPTSFLLRGPRLLASSGHTNHFMPPHDLAFPATYDLSPRNIRSELEHRDIIKTI